MKFVQFILLVALFTACGSSEKNLYVNASGLNLRVAPNSSAKVVNLIPFGTTLKVVKTDHIYKDSSGEYAWYKMANTNAFLVGKYLVAKKPKGKELRLVISMGFLHVTINTLVILRGGDVIWCNIDNGSAPHKSGYYRIIRFTGRYKIKSNGIAVVLNRRGKLRYFNNDPQASLSPEDKRNMYRADYKKNISKKTEEFLRWEAGIHGFLHSETAPLFKEKRWKLIRKKSVFITTNSTLAGKKVIPGGTDRQGNMMYQKGYLSARKKLKIKLSKAAILFIQGRSAKK